MQSAGAHGRAQSLTGFITPKMTQEGVTHSLHCVLCIIYVDCGLGRCPTISKFLYLVVSYHEQRTPECQIYLPLMADIM